ncbi:MAG: SH3 domain-containing protein [Ruminiclostridium sp.]|nr:SH3 domain-containing protein [Ruminiclostridium sp.]
MKKLKKYISVITAVLMLGAYTALPVYAEADPTAFADDDPDEIVPIEEEDDEDAEPDADAPDEEPGEIDFVNDDEDDPDETEPQEDENTLPDEDIVLITPEGTTNAGADAAANEIPPYTATGEYTMYANEVVNVRYGPDTSYSKAGTVYATSPVTVVGYSGGWLAIKYNNSIGFVASSFFSDKAPETTTAASTAETTPAPETEETTPAAAQIEETFPQETQPPVEDDTPVAETEAAERDTTVTTKEETGDDPAAAASEDDNDNKPSGLMSILIALGAAVGTFVVLGVVPVMIHRIHHNKLYQY